jgi:hypothetical protein
MAKAISNVLTLFGDTFAAAQPRDATGFCIPNLIASSIAQQNFTTLTNTFSQTPPLPISSAIVSAGGVNYTKVSFGAVPWNGVLPSGESIVSPSRLNGALSFSTRTSFYR